MARKNVIALLDKQPELGRGFKAQMARRRPVSRSDYRNAQRVMGKKDVDLADARDIRAKGIKAPATPSRPRRSRKIRSAPSAPKKKVPTPQYPTVNTRPVDDDPTKAHPRTGGKVGEAPKPRAEFDPSRTPPPLGGFRQKVKVDEHGGVSANEAPKPQTKAPVPLPQPKFNAREFAKNAAGDDWANRRNVPYNPRKDPDIQGLLKERKKSEYRTPPAPIDTLSGKAATVGGLAGVGAGLAAYNTYYSHHTRKGLGPLAYKVLADSAQKSRHALVRYGLHNAMKKSAVTGAKYGAGAGATAAVMNEWDERDKKKRRK